MEAVKQAGFDGVQFAAFGNPEELSHCRALDLDIIASARVNCPCEASLVAERVSGDGYGCATLHAGWGLENDREASKLIESILTAAERWHVPLYIETHRATIFQDMWRTVNFVRQFPGIRINGDFSHWYTGQEMVYGGFDMKFAFITPVLERVRFLHGRIGSPGCIQVALNPNSAEQPCYVEHFKRLWTTCFQNFRNATLPGERIYFTPELLAPVIYYARTILSDEGMAVEESDRWEQSLILKQIAEQCFHGAVPHV